MNILAAKCVLNGCRAWVPVSQVYLISEQYPVAGKQRKGFDIAIAELQCHVEMLRWKAKYLSLYGSLSLFWHWWHCITTVNS